MVELIILLIRAFSRAMASPPAPRQAPPPIQPNPSSPATVTPRQNPFAPPSAMTRPTGQRVTPPRTASQRAIPQRAAIPRGVSAPPRTGRRRPIAQPPVMVADPILTDILELDVDTIQKGAPIKPMTTTVATIQPSNQVKAIRGWLSPDSLKKQFILTELLQRPLSLRDHN